MLQDVHYSIAYNSDKLEPTYEVMPHTDSGSILETTVSSNSNWWHHNVLAIWNKITLQGCNMLMDTPIYTFICVRCSVRAEMRIENGWLENRLKWLPLKSEVESTLSIPSRDASLSFPLDRVLLCSPGRPVTCDNLASGPQVWDYRHSSLWLDPLSNF